ncbi:hypothetical protein C8F04DRAFT_1233161 [Mycena alexandri]|uniref:Uncharacterized protein n=1 Tax=Mycena alexandri TaxID=1745969 RepID=A0AAD6X4H3_9AGAR|nr:hypothetical protein C8F04DRAFT_1233161 [Mycena alexandri]
MNHHLAGSSSTRRTQARRVVHGQHSPYSQHANRPRDSTVLPLLARHLTVLCTVEKKKDTFTPNFRGYSTHLKNSGIISSLRPEKLKSSDFVDVSGILTSYLTFGSSGRDASFSYKSAKGKVPFPTRALGYFYYRPSSIWTPLAGSLRLRINSDDANGGDLLLPNGLPWQISLPQIVLRKQYHGVLRKLREEGLVSADVSPLCRRVFRDWGTLSQEILIFTFGQPFSLSMQHAEVRLWIVGRSSYGMSTALFVKQRLFGDPAPRYPFTGRILACFELSPDKSLVFMRVTKIVEPVVCREPGYDGRIVAPEAGELLSYINTRGPARQPVPWSLKIDRPHTTVAADALRLML